MKKASTLGASWQPAAILQTGDTGVEVSLEHKVPRARRSVKPRRKNERKKYFFLKSRLGITRETAKLEVLKKDNKTTTTTPKQKQTSKQKTNKQNNYKKTTTTTTKSH